MYKRSNRWFCSNLEQNSHDSGIYLNQNTPQPPVLPFKKLTPTWPKTLTPNQITTSKFS